MKLRVSFDWATENSKIFSFSSISLVFEIQYDDVFLRKSNSIQAWFWILLKSKEVHNQSKLSSSNIFLKNWRNFEQRTF